MRTAEQEDAIKKTALNVLGFARTMVAELEDEVRATTGDDLDWDCVLDRLQLLDDAVSAAHVKISERMEEKNAV